MMGEEQQRELYSDFAKVLHKHGITTVILGIEALAMYQIALCCYAEEEMKK